MVFGRCTIFWIRAILAMGYTVFSMRYYFCAGRLLFNGVRGLSVFHVSLSFYSFLDLSGHLLRENPFFGVLERYPYHLSSQFIS